MIKKVLIAFLASLFLLIGTFVWYTAYLRRIKLSETIPAVDKTREAKVLSAFFGLDDLPTASLLLYLRAAGKNGMPVIFSQELDPTSLDHSDFEVIAKDGSKYEVEFVTLKPANEEYELRTVLFIGEYGTHPDNPPVLVKVVDDLFSRSGQNYKGQNIEVIPLPEGPTLSYAEYFTFDDDYPYVKRGPGCDCPKEETQLVVRVVWAGGVKAKDGKELGDRELQNFRVKLVQGNDTIIVSPFQLADLKDNDNNIDLCIEEKGIPVHVEVDPGIAIDPRGDKNPATHARISPRW